MSISCSVSNRLPSCIAPCNTQKGGVHTFGYPSAVSIAHRRIFSPCLRFERAVVIDLDDRAVALLATANGQSRATVEIGVALDDVGQEVIERSENQTGLGVMAFDLVGARRHGDKH